MARPDQNNGTSRSGASERECPHGSNVPHDCRNAYAVPHDLDGKDGEPNMPFDDADAEWKKRMYSDPFNYRTHKTRQAIVRHYIRDTSTRLYLLVEEKLKKWLLKKFSEVAG